MSISSVTAVTAARAPAPAQVPAHQPEPTPAALAPAVRIDIRQGETDQPDGSNRPPIKGTSEANVARHNRIDPDTKTLVYQEVDQASGDLVVQIPDALVLKARAYAEAQAVRNQKAEQPIDRTA